MCNEYTVHATQTSLGMHTDCVAESSSYADSTLRVGDAVCTTVLGLDDTHQAQQVLSKQLCG